jgi:hypothetical protein
MGATSFEKLTALEVSLALMAGDRKRPQAVRKVAAIKSDHNFFI